MYQIYPGQNRENGKIDVKPIMMIRAENGPGGPQAGPGNLSVNNGPGPVS